MSVPSYSRCASFAISRPLAGQESAPFKMPSNEMVVLLLSLELDFADSLMAIASALSVVKAPAAKLTT